MWSPFDLLAALLALPADPAAAAHGLFFTSKVSALFSLCLSMGTTWEEQVEKELQTLQDVFKRVVKALQKQRTALFDETIKLDQEKKRARELEQRISWHCEDARIKLDVGGREFQTTVQTLTSEPGSMLEAMFSGRFAVQREEDQTVFLDRDPTYFATILNYLRDRNKNKELTTFCDIQTITGRERLRLLREVHGLRLRRQYPVHPEFC